MSTMEDRRAALLSDMAAHTAAVAQEFGVPAEVADQVGAAVADHMATHWGGQNITVPKDYAFRLSKRDEEILEAFTGNNHAQLAQQYDMTVRGIYKLIARALRRQRDLKQGKLFD